MGGKGDRARLVKEIFHSFSWLGISPLQDGEDEAKSVGGIDIIAQVHDETTGGVGPGGRVAIGEENIGVELLVMCAGQDVVGCERG